MLGQIEFLKEHAARLADENELQRRQKAVLIKQNQEQRNIIKQMRQEKQEMHDKIVAQQNELCKLYQNLEVIKEYNQRLNDKLQ